jgi:ribosomal protein RSM22 (predicted rRNA methylase)
MRVPEALSDYFKESFQPFISNFAQETQLISADEAALSERYLNRSIAPHIKRLSDTFNRVVTKSTGLAPYWKATPNPKNLRLAYFLYFMPPHLFETASIWAELNRLGFRWDNKANPKIDAIELGAGPASGATGTVAGEIFASLGIPKQGSWALIESDKAMLNLGADWARYYFDKNNFNDWDVKRFHRKLDLSLNESLLPYNAPQFNLWVLSFFLNEFHKVSPNGLLRTLQKHLSDEGLVIIIEPALKDQSRRLLELRKSLIELSRKEDFPLKVLLPCLGHQACGALSEPTDWCHEEVSWWRPPYYKTLDDLVKMDHKSLPFSYLVLTKSTRPVEEILPAFKNTKPEQRHRVVSPSHWEGKALEFYTCGLDGKKKTRKKVESESKKDKPIGRGDIFSGEKKL